MSLAIVHTRALVGLSAPEVRVEVHLGNGLPAFHIVGLPQAAVRESADRVRAALLHCGFEFPNRRLTVNLAPADLPKDSGRFDLPIAVGILAASGQVPDGSADGLEFVGELSLTGEIRAIRGALAMVLAVRAGSPRTRLVVPAPCRDEAALAADGRALAAVNLAEVVAHLRADSTLERIDRRLPEASPDTAADFCDVRGQRQARRALEVAAAGGHSVLMLGPPGAGKSMLAARFAGLLPPMEESQALECAVVQGIAGRFQPRLWGVRPFRSPHHTASGAALAGGGGIPKPGEVTLAHHGVLFLDELPEFHRAVLEVLREPLETGEITLSRAARQATYPARFQLLAAMNPCPCGYQGQPGGRCRCTDEQVQRYRARVSGPLLDRIDLQLDVPAARAEDVAGGPPGECTADIHARVMAARERMLARAGKPNAALTSGEVDAQCQPDDPGLALVRRAMAASMLSARGYHRALRVARTVADLAGQAQVSREHVAEALMYRRMDRGADTGGYIAART